LKKKASGSLKTDSKKTQVDTTDNKKLVFAVLGFFILNAFVATVVLEKYPLSGDEFSYLLQAKIFSKGAMSVPSAPKNIRRSFNTDHVINDGQIRSKYFPGWPLILALGTIVGVPWLVNPLIGALFAAFVFLIVRRGSSTRAAWIALVLAGMSPFLIFNSASYMNHISVLFFSAVALWMVGHPRAERSNLWLAGAGAVIGFAFLTRPIDGFIAGLAFFAWFKPSEYKRIFFLILGAVPIVALLGMYNHVQFGSPFTTGYEVFLASFAEGPQLINSEFNFGNIKDFEAHSLWVVDIVNWLVPCSIITIPMGVHFLLSSPKSSRNRHGRYCLAVIVLFLIVINFYVPENGDSYGPRYLLQTLLPITVLAGIGTSFFFFECKIPRSVVIGMLLLCLFICATRFTTVAIAQNEEIEKRSQLIRTVKREKLNDAVVFLNGTYRYRSRWYTRNMPYTENEVIFARWLGEPASKRVMAHYAGKKAYLYKWKEDTLQLLAQP
jgi:Dolichyl-phosphate-mannose-protein mannosyltransferase